MATAAVITVSDSRSAGARRDESGPLASEMLTALGIHVVEQRIVADEAGEIATAVRELCGRVNLIVTTGGTGAGPRDVTPEAIEPLLSKQLPGFGEIMRTGSFSKTPLSIISRGGAGVCCQALVVMLPGSPRGVRDCLELVGPAIRHVLKALSGEGMDCQNPA